VRSHEHSLEKTKITDGWACDLCHHALSPAKKQWVCSVEECSYARCTECYELKEKLAAAAVVEEVKWSTELKSVPSLLFTGPAMGSSITGDHTALSLFSMFVPLRLLSTMVNNTNTCATRPPHKWKVLFISLSSFYTHLHVTHLMTLCSHSMYITHLSIPFLPCFMVHKRETHPR
jgi:hypothetical protein